MRFCNQLYEGQASTDAGPHNTARRPQIERLQGIIKISNPKGITNLPTPTDVNNAIPPSSPTVSGDYASAREGKEPAPVKVKQNVSVTSVLSQATSTSP
jgi:hypothetical protein